MDTTQSGGRSGGGGGGEWWVAVLASRANEVGESEVIWIEIEAEETTWGKRWSSPEAMAHK
jgi:hypothetical protein